MKRWLGADKIETPFEKVQPRQTADCRGASAPSPQEAVMLLLARNAGRRSSAHRDCCASRLHRIDPALFCARGDGQKAFRRGRLIHGLFERLPELAR